MEVVQDWPSAELRIGQVAGVAVNSDDNLVLFHRADHTWDPQYQKVSYSLYHEIYFSTSIKSKLLKAWKIILTTQSIIQKEYMYEHGYILKNMLI